MTEGRTQTTQMNAEERRKQQNAVGLLFCVTFVCVRFCVSFCVRHWLFAAALISANGQAIAQATPGLLPLSKLIAVSQPRLRVGTESEPGPTLFGPIEA